MKIAIGCDHGAYHLKETVKQHLLDLGHSVCDVGCYSLDSVDYPEYAFKVGEAVVSDEADRGIVLCTTGIGVSICANKVKGVRCALCTFPQQAKMTRMHNDANVLALGAGYVSDNLALEIVDIWMNTEFEGGRHARRVNQISDYENRT
ncbi:MAG: ribose 5-phosphate isomerase B [Eubacteriales bacterium]|nr:ribose 5-phosphate isomerase B [Eubacteriales bacterium]